MYHHITGVILAGGKSSRMGMNKSFLTIDGEFIIERIAKLTSSLFKNVFISTNTPDEYEFLRLPTIQDIHYGIGPLAGIHSGLLHSTTEKIFVISCDVPLMNKETISFIVDYPTKKNIVVPKADGFVQQLCGVYSKSVVHSIELIVNESGEKRKGCRVAIVTLDGDGIKNPSFSYRISHKLKIIFICHNYVINLLLAKL